MGTRTPLFAEYTMPSSISGDAENRLHRWTLRSHNSSYIILTLCGILSSSKANVLIQCLY